MKNTYRHNHRRSKFKMSLLAVSFLVALAGLVGLGVFIYNDLNKNQSEFVQSEGRTVQQVQSDTESLVVKHDLFDFELPGDWREIDKIDQPKEQSITWQATLKNEDNRYLKVYINTIPDDPIVRLLPVTVNGSRLQRGQMSANCSTFTGSGTRDASKRRGQPPAPSKWQNVDFICDVPNIVDENIVGTGQEGQPLNTFSMTGKKGGTNQYFFVYTDRNVRPNFDILYNVINTFEAK